MILGHGEDPRQRSRLREGRGTRVGEKLHGAERSAVEDAAGVADVGTEGSHGAVVDLLEEQRDCGGARSHV